MPTSLLRELITWRLRWWGIATARAVLRHWQWFVLAGVLVPIGTPLRALLFALASPLVQALQPGHDVDWHVVRLAAIQIVAALWVLAQRQAIRGGDFRDYAETLPLTATQRRLVDLAVLVPANTVLLVPFVAGLVVASGGGRLDGSGADPAAIATVATLTLLVQIAVLERRVNAVAPILVADVVLSWALPAPIVARALMLPGAVALGAVAALAPLPRFAAARRHRTSGRGATSLRRLPPGVRIQCKALAAQPATLPRAALLAAIVAGANVLCVAFDFDGRAFPMAAMALAASALVTAGWYRTLRDAHAPVAAYMASLPVRGHFWARRDLQFLMVTGTLPAAFVLTPLIVHAAHGVLPAALLLLGYWALVAGLRWPLLRGGRQATLLAALMAGAWSVAAVAATVH